MQIIYLHRTQGHGVEGVHIWSIVDGLKNLGHQVTVVAPAGIHTAQPRRTQPVKAARKRPVFAFISQHTPEIVFELAEIAYNLLAWRRLKKSVTAAGADFVYERYAIFAVAGAWFAHRRKLPLLLEVNYTSMSPLVRKRSRLLLPLARRIDAWLFRRATVIVVVSSTLRDQLVTDYQVPPAKLLVVPNAADPKLFHPLIEPVAEINGVALAHKKVIGFVGSFTPWHGLSLFLEAFKRVAQTHPDALAVLVGDGPQKKEIERKAAEYGLAKRVLFTGAIEHQRLMHYVAAFSLGVMPDSNDYGSPMKIFEYMALGKPVVVPDYAPLLDVVTDGCEGKIFRKQDAHALASCIDAYLSDPAALAEAGRKARESVETRYNWQVNAERSLQFALARV